MLGGAEYVDQIDLERDVRQARISLFAQRLIHQRAHRDDAEPVALHRLRHAVARTRRLRRQPDHGNGAHGFQQFAQGGIVRILETHSSFSITWSSITKPPPMSNTRDSTMRNPYFR